MNVTVAVIPRERFRPLVDSLRSLFATIGPEVPVIVVDGGAPEKIRVAVRALQKERPFELIESPSFTLPNKARNVALARVTTKYVAFCDNDLSYWPGWLEAMVENAEANSATAVAPITFLGPSDPPIIHHAGGIFEERTDAQQRRTLYDAHNYSNVRLPDAEAEHLVRAPLVHQNFEYHCVMVNTQAMRAVGGHDERLVVHEHLDSSLRLMMAGGILTFEPRAKVMYQAFQRFTKEDWPYFLYRWDAQRAQDSDDVFSENWGIYKHAAPKWIKMHRERAMRTALPGLPQFLNRPWVKDRLLKMYKRYAESLNTQHTRDPALLTLPRPPADGLVRAGIARRDEESPLIRKRPAV